MSEVPKTMRAWVYRSFGEIKNVLKLEESYPVPSPDAKEVLVKVHSVALNPIGWKHVAVIGKIASPFIAKSGVTEMDLSGTVALDSADGKWKKGDRVFGLQSSESVIRSGKGVLAEYAVVPSLGLKPKPASLSDSAAAAIPLAGLTAWFALHRYGRLGPGSMVFINGGSGGVGTFAIQIAKALGAFVIATGSGEKQKLVHLLGADVSIDYRNEDAIAWLKDHHGSQEQRLDLCFDTFGSHDLYTSAGDWLKPKMGLYVDVGADIHDASFGSLFKFAKDATRKWLPGALGGGSVPYRHYMVQREFEKPGDPLGDLLKLVEGEKVKAQIDSQYAFEDALQAYEKQTSGRATGKVIINVVS